MKDSMPGRPPTAKDICAVAVTYHPDPELPERLGQVLRQVGALVIVDNASGEASAKMLRALAADPSIMLVWNSDNLGVASALNIGIRRAASLGFTWVLLLDQDTRVDPDMVRTLLAVHAAFPGRDRLAVLGSGYREVNADGACQGEGPEIAGDPWEEVPSVITSGSLIPLAAHAAVGAFRDEFFIDHVDTEYCLRARTKGYRVIRTRRAVMSHAIGAITRHSVLWMRKWTFNHSPERRYYFVRNDTVMLRESGRYALGSWALKSLGRSVRLCKRILLYERMKARNIGAVAQGWWHGVRGRMGPRPHRRSHGAGSPG